MTERVLLGIPAEETRSQIAALAERASSHDGVPALSDDTVLGRSPLTVHRLLCEGDTLVGYSALHPTDQLVELVIDPAYRNEGRGQHLLESALAERARCVWAHGDLPGARALAKSSRLSVERQLDCMVRSLPLAEARALRVAKIDLPLGWRLRALRPGEDDRRLLEINAAAFAALPDQSGWDADDLAARYTASWFDSGDVLVLCDSAAVPVGFHWTKVHGRIDGEITGEVYVLALDPRVQGQGLASELLLAGLQRLIERGCTRVILYVDRTNSGARRLYDRLDFQLMRTDVLYCVGN